MMLVIATNSFHYKYYLLLHKMWDIEERYKSMSLCLYSHFIFWMTLATAITSPLILFGWLILKFCRLIYKVCSWTAPGRTIIDFLDNKLGLSNAVNTASDNMTVAPAINLIKVAVTVFLISVLIITILCLLTMGITAFIQCFMDIPGYILGVFNSFALGCFYIFFAIGWFLCKGIYWLGFILKWFGIVVAMYAGSIIFALCILALFSFIIIAIVKISLSFKLIRDFLGFKINGFHKARKDSEKRRREMKKIREEIRWERSKKLEKIKNQKNIIKEKKASGEIPLTYAEKLVLTFTDNLIKYGRGIKRTIIHRTAQVKGGSVKVMGVFGLLFEVIKSIKDGVCPFIEFVDEKDLKEDD